MSANVDAMIREGIKASREGKKDEARVLLLKVVELDERNEQGWLWLSAVVDSIEDQQTCLENVLAINPNNEKARQGLRYLKQKAAGGAAQNPSALSSTPSMDDAFANISFTQPPTAPSVGPFSAPSFVDIDDSELPSSAAWIDNAPSEFATSSAAARRQVNEPSPSEYDDWVASLNLGGKNPSSQPDTSAPVEPAASPFIMDDIDSVGDAFGFDEEPPLPDVSRGTSRPAFDVPEDFVQDDFIAPSKAGGTAPSVSRASAPTSSFAQADDLLSDLETTDFDDTDLLEDYDHANLGEIDPQEFFKHIPAEIKMTRLPGVRERAPILMILCLILLVAANVGAVVLVIQTLTTT